MRRLCTFFLILCYLIVTPTIGELVGASEPDFSLIEPYDVHVSYWHPPPDTITENMTIIIVSPENRTYATDNLTLMVNVGIKETLDGSHYIRTTSFKADWMEASERIFYHLTSYGGVWYLMPRTISLTLDLNEIPEGNHNLTVIVRDSYDIATTSTVYFTNDSSFIPEFPSWTSIIFVIIILAVVIGIYRRRLSKNQSGVDN
jgi:hypothetical protein